MRGDGKNVGSGRGCAGKEWLLVAGEGGRHGRGIAQAMRGEGAMWGREGVSTGVVVMAWTRRGGRSVYFRSRMNKKTKAGVAGQKRSREDETLTDNPSELRRRVAELTAEKAAAEARAAELSKGKAAAEARAAELSEGKVAAEARAAEQERRANKEKRKAERAKRRAERAQKRAEMVEAKSKAFAALVATAAPFTSHAQAAEWVQRAAEECVTDVAAEDFFRGFPEVDAADAKARWEKVVALGPRPGTGASEREVVQPYLSEVYMAGLRRRFAVKREVKIPAVVLVETKRASKYPENAIDHGVFFRGDEGLAASRQSSRPASAKMATMASGGESKTTEMPAARHQLITYTDRRWKETYRMLGLDAVGAKGDVPLRKYGWCTNVDKIQFVRQQARVDGQVGYTLQVSEELDFLPRTKPLVPAEPTAGWLAFLRLHSASARELGVVRPPLPPGHKFRIGTDVVVRIARRVALGGWSDVYEGAWTRGDRSSASLSVAVKVTARVGDSHLDVEAAALRRLNEVTDYPAIPILLGGDESEYIVTAPLGANIWDELGRGPAASEQDARDVVVARIASGLLGALREAHAAGLAHLDVRPDNVVWAGDHVLLVDWGAARALGEELAGLVGVAAFAHDDILRASLGDDVDWLATMGRGGAPYICREQLDLASVAYTLAALRASASRVPPWHQVPPFTAAAAAATAAAAAAAAAAPESVEDYIAARQAWFDASADAPTKALLAAAQSDGDFSDDIYDLFD
jgi:hypothetical protein